MNTVSTKTGANEARIAVSGEIMRGQEQNTYYFVKGRNVGFIAALPKSGGNSIAIHFSESAVVGRSYMSKLELFFKESSMLSSVEYKVVGSAEFVQGISDLFLSKNLTLAKTITIADLEILFFPENGRIRLAKGNPPLEVIASSLARKKIKVLIVDDSKAIRDLLHKVISSDHDLEVVASASLPSEVEALVVRTKPDVITLDMHMPEMDGATLLKRLMPKFPIPTIVISSLSMEEGSLVLTALENGAVDYVQKPSFKELKETSVTIIEKIKMASTAKVVLSEGYQKKSNQIWTGKINPHALIAIGSSTGGPEALKDLLTALPANIPPTLVVQHIPAFFSAALADRLNGLCNFRVAEAKNGDLVLPNQVLIAPGGQQMRLAREGGQLIVVVEAGPPKQLHKPCVDILFNSVAEVVGGKAIGAVLTGMGSDGANGAVKMKETGSRIVAQDEASCVVFGMPKETIKRCQVDLVRPLNQIPDVLMNWSMIGS